jgi:hypothetical protein
MDKLDWDTVLHKEPEGHYEVKHKGEKGWLPILKDHVLHDIARTFQGTEAQWVALMFGETIETESAYYRYVQE